MSTEALRAALAELVALRDMNDAMNATDSPEEHERLYTAGADRASAAWEAARTALAQREDEPVAWIPVAERMPKSGQTVLACYTNSAGNVRRIRAEWVADKSVEASSESEIGVYDEATDTCYDPAGWYEKIDNWGDYSSVAVVEGEITHWMQLPAFPGAAAPAAPAYVPLSDGQIDMVILGCRKSWADYPVPLELCRAIEALVVARMRGEGK
jgi:Protein of unknown function (DUF551)